MFIELYFSLLWRNKRARYQAYADRANEALAGYKEALAESGLLP